MSEIKINCILAGVQKAGTSSLFNWLSQHPDVFGPTVMKDYNFFGRPDLLKFGVSYLHRFYAGASAEAVMLHGFVHYVDNAGGAREKIYDYNEDCKIILVYREPVSRAYSAFWEYRKVGNESEKFFSNAVLLEDGNVNRDSIYVKKSTYYEDFKAYADSFGPKNVFIVSFETLIADPILVCQRIFRFLGVDESFVVDPIKINESGAARFEILQKLMQRIKIPNELKKLLPMRFLVWLKIKLIRDLNTVKFDYPPIDDLAKAKLDEYFQEDYELTREHFSKNDT